MSGSTDELDVIRENARRRAEAKAAYDEQVRVENEGLRRFTAGREKERGIYSRLARASGWSDEYIRKVVQDGPRSD